MDVVDLVSDDEEDLLDAAYVKEEYDEDQEGMEFGDQDGYFSEYTEEPMENIKQEGDSSMNNTNEQNSPQKTFSCDECSRVYHNRQSLWYHKKTHNPDPPESCSVCEKIFTNPVSLRKHMRAHDREMRMASTTQQSLKSVETEVLLSYSQTVVKEEPKYDAPLTLQDYHWAEEAEDTGQKRFQCTLCPRSYMQSYNLTRHYRMHKLGVFSCDICRLTFKKQTYLINHKKTHENKEINEQKNRPRTPKTKVKAEYNTPSRFPRLAKTAANAATLQQQQIPVVQQSLPPVKPRPTATKVKRSNPKQKRFQCEKCFTTFKHSRNLFRHRQLHLRKGPFSCDICGICFPEEKSMNLHRGKHPDMTPLAQKIAENTELAEESWESIGEQYTVTMEVGTDEIETSSVAKDEDDPYKCTVCNVFFMMADNFERHMRWKHNIEPNIQDYTFKSNHKSEEDEEEYEAKPQQYYQIPIKPHYQCEFCKRNFLEKDMHDRHLDAAHYGMTPATKASLMDYQEGEIPTGPPMVATTSHVNSVSGHLLKKERLKTNKYDKKVYPCHLCGLEYKWHHDRLAHLRQHERGELIAKCPYCEGRFRTKRGIVQHIGLKHKKGSSKIVRPFLSQKIPLRIKKRRVQVKQENAKRSIPKASESYDATSEQFPQQQGEQDEPSVADESTNQSNSGKNQCNVCFIFFTTKQSLARHMKAHNPDRKMYKCRLCGLEYFWYQDLHSHMKLHERGELTATCPQCNGAFRTEKGVLGHIARHHKPGKINTGYPRIMKSVVPSKTVQMKTMKKVIKQEKGSESAPSMKYECKICFKCFREPHLLKKHKILHNGPKQEFTCPLCGLGYLWDKNLQTHIRQHQRGQLKASCPKCKGMFATKQGVVKHMSRKHKDADEMNASDITYDQDASQTQDNNENDEDFYKTNESTASVKQEGSAPNASTLGQFQCNICPSFFFDSHSLQQHMEETHKESKKMYSCPQCGLQYSWPSDLQAHIKRHERGELTIKCNECEGRFKTQLGLIRHVNSTHKEHKIIPHNIIITPNIKKMLQRGSNFIKRRNRPTIDSNFQCNVCTKLFHSKNNLKRHMVTHNPNRKLFPCLVCGLEYSWYQDLQYHMMRHDRGELPSKCPYCEARFKSDKGVIRHVNLKHKEEM